MKKILTTLLLFVGLAAFAQTAQQANTSTNQTATTALSPKAKSLCKTWSLTKTENFGDQHNPTDAQKKDQIILMETGRYRMIMDGVAQGGTWTLDKSNTLLTLTKDDGTIIKLKVLESTDTTLKVDYRDADDIHNILYYTAS